jgi:hypothetical protein
VLARLGTSVATSPLSLLGLATDIAAALSACILAVRESMRPSEFVLSVVLSSAQQGSTKEQLRKDVRIFLDNDPRIFPWYLGIDEKLFAKAEELRDDTDFDNVLAALEKRGFVRRDDTQYHYVERNVSLKVV